MSDADEERDDSSGRELDYGKRIALPNFSGDPYVDWMYTVPAWYNTGTFTGAVNAGGVTNLIHVYPGAPGSPEYHMGMYYVLSVELRGVVENTVTAPVAVRIMVFEGSYAKFYEGGAGVYDPLLPKNRWPFGRLMYFSWTYYHPGHKESVNLSLKAWIPIRTQWKGGNAKGFPYVRWGAVSSANVTVTMNTRVKYVYISGWDGT